MAETLTPSQIAAHRAAGADFSFDEETNRKIEGFNELIAQLKDLVEVQRANAGADMLRSEASELRSETQAQLIQAVQKLASRAPSGGMSQTVLEDLVVQLGQRPEKEPNPVYVFDISRNQTTGYIDKIIATPQVA